MSLPQQAEHTLPCLQEVYRTPITDTSVSFGYTAVILSTVLTNKELHTNNNRVFIFVAVVIIAIIYASGIALATLQLKKLKYMDRIHHFKVFVICLLGLSNRFKRKPPRRGQPLYKGQMFRPQCVLRSEVLP